MKKSLVLAMAMALGVTASAYAANPFSDVPAGHWAYDSIDKLAAAGVIEGMGDGTYQGDKTMTRYEMAQIVAKAMAKGANVDKLAAEFADELDNLGVRVANLEKKADNVKISGYVRLTNWHYAANQGMGGAPRTDSTNHKTRLRSNLVLTGNINENWSYTGVIRNEQWLDNSAQGKGEEDTRFMDAYVSGRLGGLAVTAGRFEPSLEDGVVYEEKVDGIQVSYGKDIKVTAGYAQTSNAYTPNPLDTPTAANQSAYDKVIYGRVDAKLSKAVAAHVGLYMFDDKDDLLGANKYYYTSEGQKIKVGKKVVGYTGSDDNKIATVGANWKVNKNVSVSALGLRSNIKSLDRGGDRFGQVYNISYKGAKRGVAGSYGLYAYYYDKPASTYAVDWHDAWMEGSYRGVQLGARYIPAKNITLGIDWYGLKDSTSYNKRVETTVAMVQMNF